MILETIAAIAGPTFWGFCMGRLSKKKKKTPELTGPRWTVNQETDTNDDKIIVYIQDRDTLVQGDTYIIRDYDRVYDRVPKRIEIGSLEIQAKPIRDTQYDKVNKVWIPVWVNPEDTFEDDLAELIVKAQDKARTLNAYEGVIQ